MLGLAPEGSATPIGIYRGSLDWMPDWLVPLIGRFLHLEVWIFALALLLIVPILASFALDWAFGGDATATDDYL
ncbi:MAG: hypothetical protein DI616_08895 [Paracoccus denitrificans]|uniref:Uncharacterized protein n=1 Tax=Paracoccus denitrificans TaxID=266 RepID=A0A533I7W9_PARDE|nr:MAG: hypothetical protein DI616_08895 [Paracoccus denitrificans]